MALQFDDKTFFHIPRTGGTYVRSVIQQTTKKLNEIGHPHSAPKKYTQNGFCVVRNPLDWYQSFYRYRADNGWGKKTVANSGDLSYAGYVLDRDCIAASFGEFIKLVIKSHPDGFLTKLYKLHAERCQYVLRTETLTENLELLFRKWNYPFPHNISATNATSKAIDTTINPALVKQILEVEKNCFKFDRQKWAI